MKHIREITITETKIPKAADYLPLGFFSILTKQQTAEALAEVYEKRLDQSSAEYIAGLLIHSL